jgi:hypothetical protein
MIGTGSSVTSMLKQPSSRCVPSWSRPTTQRIGTRPAPALDQRPVRLT